MKSYPERRRRQQALAIAQRLVTSLATGLYCGASGMPCDRAGADCCMKSLPEKYQEFAQSPPASSEGDRE